MRKQACARGHLLGEPDGLEDLLDFLLLFGGEAGKQALKNSLGAGQGQLQIFEDAVPLKHGGALELATHAALGNLVFTQVSEIGVVTYQEDAALVGLGFTGDHVLQRGLTGAVGANDAA